MIANILSIAGTDPTGGAGMQADLKTFAAMGTYGMGVVTAVVAQNTRGVRAFVPMDAAFVADQIDAVFEDVRVDAVKIGMVANAAIASTIAERLVHHQAKNIVVDPVMVAKSGDLLLSQDAVEIIRDILVPSARIITPNLPEAGVLLDIKPQWSLEEMHRQAPNLLKLGAESVLLKGGHLHDSAEAVDLFCSAETVQELIRPRIHTTNDNGTGCTLSAAIAALLPQKTLLDSATQAKTYLTDALSTSTQLDVGHGRGPVNHLHNLWPA